MSSTYRCSSCFWQWEDSSFFSGVKADGCPSCKRNIIREITEKDVTTQAILEKAIQKAIDGGWEPIKKITEFNYSVAPWLDVLFIQIENPYIRSESKWTCNDVIFNHSFAKALWGEKQVSDNCKCGIDMRKKHPARPGSTHGPIIRDGWQEHLQKMVISPDPIAYLQEYALNSEDNNVKEEA